MTVQPNPEVSNTRHPPAHVHTYILLQRLRDSDFDRSEMRRHVCRRLTGIFKVADAEGLDTEGE